MGTDHWQPLGEMLGKMVEAGTIAPEDRARLLFTDSVDEAMQRILGAAQGFGLVWRPVPRWYLGEGRMKKAE
jgi:predicted Rossmann-fold nucleotide-binding protein